MKDIIKKVAGIIVAVICYGLYREFDAIDYAAWITITSAIALPFLAILELFTGDKSNDEA